MAWFEKHEIEEMSDSGGHYSTMIHGHALRKSIDWVGVAQCVEVARPLGKVGAGVPKL